jgi:TatD DNase family protein
MLLHPRIDEAVLVAARRALDQGFSLSIAGIVTFPRAESLREVARFVPADRLLTETDAPFLAPVPHRGQRNEPAWVAETVAKLATLSGTTVAAVSAQVSANFRALVGRARVDTPAKPVF